MASNILAYSINGVFYTEKEKQVLTFRCLYPSVKGNNFDFSSSYPLQIVRQIPTDALADLQKLTEVYLIKCDWLPDIFLADKVD